MLSKEIIKKIKKFHIKSRKQVDSFMAGQYKSVFKGTGMEFEEVREYTPGDEVKNIDWKVSARMGKPFVKLYKEEREVIVMLLIDMSQSGRFGSQNRSKIDTAAEIGAILAFNAIRNNDKIGVILFTDDVEKYIPPKKGSSHIFRVIKEIFTFSPENTGTNIETALDFLGRVSHKRTVTIIISDFIDTQYLKKMKIASKKHEIISILVSDPNDFALPSGGIFILEDFETGRQMVIDASDKNAHNAYNTLTTKAYSQTTALFKKEQIDCIELKTSDSVADALTHYFRIREKRLSRGKGFA